MLTVEKDKPNEIHESLPTISNPDSVVVNFEIFLPQFSIALILKHAHFKPMKNAEILTNYTGINLLVKFLEKVSLSSLIITLVS